MLRKRKVDEELRLFVKKKIFPGAGHANDFNVSFVLFRAEVFADSALAGPDFFGKGFVDNGDLGRRGRVRIGESPALNHGSTAGAKIAGLDFVVPRSFRFGFIVYDLAFGENVDERIVVAHGDIGADGRIAHAGQGTKPFRHLLIELLAAFFRIALKAEVHTHHERVVHAKAHVHVSGIFQAANEKAGAGEKQERDSDLGDDERVAEPMTASGAAAGAATGFQGVRQIGSRSLKRRHEAGDNTGQQGGDERKGEDAPIEAKVEKAERDVGRYVNARESHARPTR